MFVEAIHRKKLPWKETYRFVIANLASFFYLL